MTTQEQELKGLILASLDGDAAAHRSLLNQLSGRLRLLPPATAPTATAATMAILVGKDGG
jgi:hypothetical protein